MFVTSFQCASKSINPTDEATTRATVPPCVSPPFKRGRSYQRRSIMRSISPNMFVTSFQRASKLSAAEYYAAKYLTQHVCHLLSNGVEIISGGVLCESIHLTYLSPPFSSGAFGISRRDEAVTKAVFHLTYLSPPFKLRQSQSILPMKQQPKQQFTHICHLLSNGVEVTGGARRQLRRKRHRRQTSRRLHKQGRTQRRQKPTARGRTYLPTPFERILSTGTKRFISDFL